MAHKVIANSICLHPAPLHPPLAVLRSSGNNKSRLAFSRFAINSANTKNGST